MHNHSPVTSHTARRTTKQPVRKEPTMKHLFWTAWALALTWNDRVRQRDQRGSVTTEHVLWAVAVIAIVGVVVAAVKTYVESQAGKIK